MENMDEKGKSKGLWHNVWKRRRAGKRPKRPGEKGYPSKKAWKELTSEASEALRALIREVLEPAAPVSSSVRAPMAAGRDMRSFLQNWDEIRNEYLELGLEPPELEGYEGYEEEEEEHIPGA